MFRATTPARRPGRAAAVALAALTAAVAGAAALGACRDLTAPEQDPTTVRYADSLHIRFADFTRDTSGVYYQDLVVGSGLAAVTGSLVREYYTGYLTDGRLFDTNVNPTVTTQPDTFFVGSGSRIRGFDRGLVGVRAGGRRRLIIPPALAYGNRTVGRGIPAGSVLIFVVDVPAVVAPATTTTTTARAPR